MSQRVFVAMSGGVDSAAAALLLRQAGYDVTGVTLRLHPYKDRPGLCGSADDIETARAVAAGMGIPYVVLDLCDLFRERVMDRFVWAYTHGRTPNPCIDCNREIKFGALLDWALDQGADSHGHRPLRQSPPQIRPPAAGSCCGARIDGRTRRTSSIS